MRKPELFYTIADPGGAAARKAIMERGLLERFRFRNLHYEEVARDLAAHHGPGEARLPALWDGAVLHEGIEAVLAAIAAIAR